MSSRVTDSLLHPGKGHSPSYGINEEGSESSEAGKSEVKVSIFHIKERVWTIALFSLIACLGSVVIGMLLGYSTNTLSELSTSQEGGDEKYVIANGTWTASLFGVSVLCLHYDIDHANDHLYTKIISGTLTNEYSLDTCSRHLVLWGLYLEHQWHGPYQTNSDVNLHSYSAQFLV